jgi:hypothetical protein
MNMDNTTGRESVVNLQLGSDLVYTVHHERIDEAGLWNPGDNEPTVEGGFQINVYGTSRGFKAFGEYLLKLAALDTSADEGFHEHVETTSADGRTRLHLILRKNEKFSPKSVWRAGA